MTKEELEAAQKLIDTPITEENVDEPLVAFFPRAESRPSELGSHEEANLPRDAAGTRPEDSSMRPEVIGQWGHLENDPDVPQTPWEGEMPK